MVVPEASGFPAAADRRGRKGGASFFSLSVLSLFHAFVKSHLVIIFLGSSLRKEIPSPLPAGGEGAGGEKERRKKVEQTIFHSSLSPPAHRRNQYLAPFSLSLFYLRSRRKWHR